MIKVDDVVYAMFRAPDLDRMENFLVDFGLMRAHRTESHLYMRACGRDQYAHITELGDPAFVGMGFRAKSEKDLFTLANKEECSSVAQLDRPGGGKYVQQTDPNGFKVEVVHGIETVKPLELENNYKFNFGNDTERYNEFIRLKKGPTQCLRLGHVVIGVSDFKESNKFYKSNFGFLDSDVCYEGDKENVILVFNRVDRGKA